MEERIELAAGEQKFQFLRLPFAKFTARKAEFQKRYPLCAIDFLSNLVVEHAASEIADAKAAHIAKKDNHFLKMAAELRASVAANADYSRGWGTGSTWEEVQDSIHKSIYTKENGNLKIRIEAFKEVARYG